MTENKEKDEYAVALGVFDGIHIGHKVVIGTMMLEKNLKRGIFTFKTETIPQKGGKKLEYIYSTDYKECMLSLSGIDRIYSADYSEICDMDGDTFCKKILCDYFNAKKIFCGYDFRFGKGAAWGVDDLTSFGIKYGFEVLPVNAVSAPDEPSKKMSSSDIRKFLKNGEVKKANEYLGIDFEYSIYGEVVEGKKIGRTIDFPTINQIFKKGQLVPKYGVYLSKVYPDYRLYNDFFWGVTNIGVKPTVTDENIPLAETHILDFSGNLYGKKIKVSLEDFIRPEMKFENIDELKNQIEADIKTAKKIKI